MCIKKVGVYVIFMPPHDMEYKAMSETQTSLCSHAKSIAHCCYIETLFGKRMKEALSQSEGTTLLNFDSLCNMKHVDTIIFAGSEVSAFVEAIVSIAREYQVPIHNFAHPGSELDDYWHEMSQGMYLAN